LCLTINSSHAAVSTATFLLLRSASRETDGELSCAITLWISFSSSSSALIFSYTSFRNVLTPPSLHISKYVGKYGWDGTHDLPFPLSRSLKLSLPSLLLLPLLLLSPESFFLAIPRSLPSFLLRLSLSRSISSSFDRPLTLGKERVDPCPEPERDGASSLPWNCIGSCCVGSNRAREGS